MAAGVPCCQASEGGVEEAEDSLILYLLYPSASTSKNPLMAWEPNLGWTSTEDGNWSTFPLWVGRPPQRLNALVSFSGKTLRLPFSQDQTLSSHGYSHISHENDSFNPLLSETWLAGKGSFAGSDLFRDDPQPRPYDRGGFNDWRVPIEESYSQIGTAFFGVRPVTFNWNGKPNYLRHLRRKNAPSVLQSSPVFLGFSGPPDTDNKTESANMTYLYYRAMSYSYSAGAWYKDSPALFTLGSYYHSRRANGTIQLPLSDDQDALLSLEVSSVTVSGDSSADPFVVLGQPSIAVLDSTQTFLELPEESCDMLSSIFGLQYDEAMDIFFVSKDFWRSINPDLTLSFSLNGLRHDRDQSLLVELPLAALNHCTRIGDECMPYFPIRRAHEGSRIVLGRVFFQETYLVVNYENLTFSLSNTVPIDESQELWAMNVVGCESDVVEVVGGWVEREADRHWQMLRSLFLIVVISFLVTRLLIPWSLGLTKWVTWKRRQEQLRKLWIENHYPK